MFLTFPSRELASRSPPARRRRGATLPIVTALTDLEQSVASAPVRKSVPSAPRRVRRSRGRARRDDDDDDGDGDDDDDDGDGDDDDSSGGRNRQGNRKGNNSGDDHAGSDGHSDDDDDDTDDDDDGDHHRKPKPSSPPRPSETQHQAPKSDLPPPAGGGQDASPVISPPPAQTRPPGGPQAGGPPPGIPGGPKEQNGDQGGEKPEPKDLPPPPDDETSSAGEISTPTATPTSRAGDDAPPSTTDSNALPSVTTSESGSGALYPDLDASTSAEGLPGALSPSPTNSDIDGPTPSSGQGTAVSRKGFPLPAAAAIGAILSFLVVSSIVWGLWFWLRKRRRARAPPPDWDFAPPAHRMSYSTYEAPTVSTDIPRFLSASEAGAPDWKSRNPFAHPADERERDPFGGSSLRRGNTLGTVSTMSV